MLQPTIFKLQKAPLSLFAVDYTDSPIASPARMNVSRVTLDASTNPRSGLPPQEVEYIRNCFAATEFAKHQSGMSVNTGAHSKRSYIDKSGGGESAEDVEWGEAPRGVKRREFSIERESRFDRYTEADPHHHHQSAGSDLTTEQSVFCMAADDQSNSTRSTSSLNEDGCLLKLHSAVPPLCGYGDLSPDVDEDDHSSKLACADAAACASYNVHAACASYTYFPTPLGQEHWLAAPSHHACANYEDHIQHDPHNVKEQDEEEVEADWLELRLGQNNVCDGVTHMSRSSSPCTLQLLPEEPDCAVMRQREKHKELSLCSEENYERMSMASTTNFEQAARPPLMSHGQHHFEQLGNTTESNRPHFYTNLMQANCLPMPPADCTIGQYITSRGLLPIHYNVVKADDRSCNPTMSALDHHHSTHMQQLLQDVAGIHEYRPPLQDDNLSQSRASAASLHALQGQSSFRSMVYSTLREGVVGSCPIPTSWDLLSSSSSQSPSDPMLRQPVATSFRDLIASSLAVQEPFNKLGYGSVPSLPGLPKLGDSLHHHMMWPCSKMHHSQGSSSLVNYCSDAALAANEGVNTSPEYTGSKSMSDWLSQALSATTFDPVNQRLAGDGDHGRKSKLHQPLLKLIRGGHSAAAARGSPGFWFALQPSNREPDDGGAADINMQSKTSYVRLKDGNVPISVVKKFLITKLGLSQESQVAFACRGKLLEESSYLKKVQDDIWLPPNFAQIETLNFKSVDSNMPKDNVMILTYHILK